MFKEGKVVNSYKRKSILNFRNSHIWYIYPSLLNVNFLCGTELNVIRDGHSGFPILIAISSWLISSIFTFCFNIIISKSNLFHLQINMVYCDHFAAEKATRATKNPERYFALLNHSKNMSPYIRILES